MQGSETLTQDEKSILEPYVTNTDQPVFCLRNLPEVVKGALFSRYSRSNLGLRKLLVKEFLDNNDVLSSGKGEEAEKAIKKAEAFYDRVLDGYGDDSIGELGGAHVAFEDVSIIASKIIEDARIGGAPLEKSTRYIYFDRKYNDDYRFYKVPEIMASQHKELYLSTCRNLFKIYSELITPLTEFVSEKIPKGDLPEGVWTATVRARVLDSLRGLLPASTQTNLGIFGNGRFFENLLQKMKTHKLQEIRDIGEMSRTELNKIIPSFVRKAEENHRHFKSYEKFHSIDSAFKKDFLKNLLADSRQTDADEVTLIDWTPNAERRVAAAMMYELSDIPLEVLREKTMELSEDKIKELFSSCYDNRQNRRHKPPRAFEHADYTFDLTGDYGMFRDLHRHRMLTQERQMLKASLGYVIPEDIIAAGLKEKYTKALDEAGEAWKTIYEDLPDYAQYIVPMAYKIRWYFKINLRSLIWLTELRSAPQGHINYRRMAQKMAKAVMKVHPLLAPFFKFVNFEGAESGRLEQEMKSFTKKQQELEKK